MTGAPYLPLDFTPIDGAGLSAGNAAAGGLRAQSGQHAGAAASTAWRVPSQSAVSALAGKNAPSERAVRLLRADTVPLEPVHWLWPGFLPAGMLTILGGAPGCGKTTVALSIAAVVTQAGRWPGGTRCQQAGDVLIWSGEDAQSVTVARLKAAGAELQRVHLIDGVTGRGDDVFDPGRDMAPLETAAGQLRAPRLLIIDPIVSAVAGDGHKSNDVRRALQPVVLLAQRLGCAVLGITHFTKGTSGRDPVERITGSLAFAALARLVLVAAKVKAEDGDDDRRVLVRAKSNIGPDDGGYSFALTRVPVADNVEGQRVTWGDALKGSARDVLAEAEGEPAFVESESKAGVDSFLRNLLIDGPLPAKVVKDAAYLAGYALRTVQRASTRLGVERRKDGLKGGWVWALTKEHPSALPAEDAEDAEDARRVPLAPLAPSGLSVAPSGGDDDVEVI